MSPNNKRNKAPNNLKEHKINREIRAYYVYLIDSENDRGRSMAFDEALATALSQGLDLVQVAVNSEGPICKIMDYGKYCFEKNKNKVKPKKNESKNIQITPSIQENDLLIKLKQVKNFLQDKYKVQIVVKMQGRQADYPNIALDMLYKFIQSCSEISKVDSGPKIDGKKGFLTLSPK